MSEPTIIDLGCGPWKLKGAIGIDFEPTVHPDILCDIVKDGIPLADDSADQLFTSLFMEHIPFDRASFVFGEIWRVCKPGAIINIVVPSYGHPTAHSSEHPIAWSARTFKECNGRKSIFQSWFDVIDLLLEYDPDYLALAKQYFPNMPDDVLGKLFLGVIQHIRLTCTPKGKGEWTQVGGVREHHWSYYAYGYDIIGENVTKKDTASETI